MFKIINLNKYYQNITCFVFISVTNKGLKLSGNVLHWKQIKSLSLVGILKIDNNTLQDYIV